jgi:hypothetical protein
LWLAAAVVPGVSNAAASPSTSCLFSGTNTFHWVGGPTGDFFVKSNWSPRRIPGISNSDVPTAKVCIPSGADVTLYGNGVSVLAIDSEGALTLEHGAQLFVGAGDGSAPAPDSIVNDLVLDSSTLGGTAKVTVTGSLDWHSDPVDEAATQTTRRLTSLEPEGNDTTAPQFPGSTVIAKTATAAIDGGTSTDGGVNLEDNRTLDIAGSLVVSNGGFVAADWGTAIKLESTGVLTFDNDGGVYEGHLQNYRPWASGPATFANTGTVDKASGTGGSVIGALYSGNGAVEVHSGQFGIVGQNAAVATVSPGASIGFGTCPGGGGGRHLIASRRASGSHACPAPITNQANPQAASFTLSNTDPATSVAISLDPKLSSDPYRRFGLVGRPVAVAIAAPGADPSSVAMRVDSTLLNPGTTLNEMRVGLLGSHDSVLASCDPNTPVPPCVSDRRSAADDPKDFVLTVLAAASAHFIPLGPRLH